MLLSKAPATAGGRVRRSLATLAALVVISGLFVGQARLANADAGNPILGSINGKIVKNFDGTYTVFVRGEWNWLSHNSDCNSDRAGTGVGLIWNDPNEPGFPLTIQSKNGTLTNGSKTVTNFLGTITPGVGNRVSGTGIPAGTYLTAVSGSSGNWTLTLSKAATVTGTKSLTLSADVGVASTANGLNQVDQMVHPVDIGNAPRGLPGQAGQTFFDPSPPNTGSSSTWRAGCGREPLTQTTGTGTTGCGETPSSADCSGHPWGSWGYDKNLSAGGDSAGGGGQGYSHTYLHRSDINTVCANFYDQHGSNQVSSSSLSVNGNSDNSIQTNAFNPSQGANCISFPGIDHTTAVTNVTVGSNIHDTAVVVGATAGQNLYVQFHLYGPTDPTCTGTDLISANARVQVSGGSATSANYDTTVANGGAGAGSYHWTADLYDAATGGNQLDHTGCGDTGETSVVTNPQIKVTKTPHSQMIAPGGTATWNIHVENTGDVTLTNVHVTDAQAADCVRTSSQIAADPNAPHTGTATFNPGDTYDYSCSKANVSAGFQNVVVACGTNVAADDTCDNSNATLGDRTGSVIVASTKQNFVPNDNATISGLVNPNGNLRFKLYKGTDCAANGTQIFDSGDIPVGADGTFNSGNATLLSALNSNAGLGTGTAGTYLWLVTYGGDTNGNAGFTIACGSENFTVTN